ncbi:MAG: phosphodiester glycosidase family protein [Chloroflexi bacterium]|nr:phosphodiester glycosidase family protein [Chloroflexota bacterium]
MDGEFDRGPEFAQMFQTSDCSEVYNPDGGGSSTIYFRLTIRRAGAGVRYQ